MALLQAGSGITKRKGWEAQMIFVVRGIINNNNSMITKLGYYLMVVSV